MTNLCVLKKWKIYLKDNCIPYCVSSPCPILLRFQKLTQLEIAKHIPSGIINLSLHVMSPQIGAQRGRETGPFDDRLVRPVTPSPRLPTSYNLSRLPLPALLSWKPLVAISNLHWMTRLHV